MTEKIIENQIMNYLAFKQIFAWKNQTTGIYDPVKKVFRKSRNVHHLNGVADILGIYKCRLLAIEVKTERGRASPDQLRFLENVNRRGGIAFVARSIQDVEEQLNKLIEEKK